VFVSREQKVGFLYALAAFGFWGLGPLYFKAVAHVPPLEVLAHRVLWSVVLTALLIALGRDWPALRRALASPRVVATLALTGTLVACNWLIFIHAVVSDQVLEASLGYFINPLLNVLLGMVFLRETLRPRQALAVLLAAAGTANLALSYGKLPLIALGLAFTFGIYGLLRKTVRIEAVNGLFAETTLVLPLALAWLGWLGLRGEGQLVAGGATTTLLLMAAGPVTALPLVWFTAGARRLRYGTIGIIHYLAPTLQFLLAVAVFREPFGRVHLITFGLIWAGLALYTADSLAHQRRVVQGTVRR
jgi:chloramphenicol-sensitive protein RarD